MTINKLYNKIVKTACLMLAVFASMPVLAQESMRLGYCQDRAVTYFSVANSGTGGSAIHLPETTMQAYKGCRITEINVGISTASEKTPVRVFITRSLDEAPLYEQTLDVVKRNWNTVTLDTPFDIDGSDIYIGYEVTGQYYLNYCNAFIDGEEWINRGGGVWEEYAGIYSAALYATVTGDNLPRNNVRLGNVTIPGYAVTGEQVGFSGDFVNLGFDPVTSLTFTFTADGETVGEETVAVESTANRGTGTFQLNGFSFASSGTKTVSIAVSAVNGEADADPSDNVSRTKSVVCLDEFVQRNVLLEFFSTENCTNCPGVHSTVDPVIDGLENIIEISHHAGFYTDQFTIEASTAYEWFYGGRLYAPAMMLDRTNFADNLPNMYTEGCPIIGVSPSQLLGAYQEALNVPALAEVNMSRQYDSGSRKLSLTVGGRQLLPLENADKLRLYVFITEDSICSTTQAGAAGDFYHRHSARLSVTPTWGAEVDVANGFENTYDIDIPEDWNVDMLSAVAFVGYYDPEDCNNCAILNSVETAVTDGGTAGIGVIDAAGALSPVKFDGENIITPGGHSGVSVFDMSGTRLFHAPEGGTFTPLGSLPHGMYVVNVNTANRIVTLKIVL